MPREYRSRTRIVLDVLRAVRDEGEQGVTRVVYRANLSHERLGDYLTEVKDKGWVEEREEDRRVLVLTDEGHKVVGELARVVRFLEDFGLDL